MTTLPKPIRQARILRAIERSMERIRTRRPVGTVRREAKAAGHVDQFTWDSIVAFYEGLCCFCESERAQEQEHFIPLSRGGPHAPENIGPTCSPCNQSKGTRIRFPRRRHPFMDVPQG